VAAYVLLLDGGSLFREFGFDIRLSLGLWCSSVSTVSVALVPLCRLLWLCFLVSIVVLVLAIGAVIFV
jgi:hypothetical protein